MLSLLLIASALAATIQVTTATPGIVAVDGRALPVPTDGGTWTARALSAGAHRVEVRNLLGRTITAMDVTVAADETVRMAYERKRLRVLAQGEGAPASLPGLQKFGQDMAAVAVQVDEAITGAVEDAVEGAQGATPAPAPAPAPAAPAAAAVAATPGATGSLQVTGGSPLSDKVWLDGVALPHAAGDEAFVAVGVSPGVYELVVERDGRVIYAGQAGVQADWNQRCGLAYKGAAWDVECHLTRGAVAGVNDTLGTVSAGGASLSVQVNITQGPTDEEGRPEAMSSGNFSHLFAEVNAETFSSDKIAVIRSAAARNHFSIDQMGRLMDDLTHSSDKVEAARLMAPKVVDPENAYQLNSHLTFSSDKEAVQALF